MKLLKWFRAIPDPSQIDNMQAMVSRFWCRKGYDAITIFGRIFTRSPEMAERLNSRFDALKVHEMIHLRQAQSTHDSWLLFYLRYGWFSLGALRYTFRMKSAAYYLNPFEMEAYRFMWSRSYLDEKCRGGAVAWKTFAKMSLAARLRYVRKYNLAG